MKAKNSYYFFDTPIKGYKKSAGEDLAKSLEDLGLKFKLYERGGGVETQEVVHKVIAYVSLHEFWLGVLSSLTASYIEKLLKKLNEWRSKNKIGNDDSKEVIEIYIRSNVSHRKFYVYFDLETKYSKSEIKEKIKEVKKNNQL